MWPVLLDVGGCGCRRMRSAYWPDVFAAESDAPRPLARGTLPAQGAVGSVGALLGAVIGSKLGMVLFEPIDSVWEHPAAWPSTSRGVRSWGNLGGT